VDLRVRLTRIGGTDAVLTEVRGSTTEAATVRFGRTGQFAYYRGAAKIRTLVSFRLGAWYRSIVVVHVGSRTYDWRLLDAAGHQLISVARIPWKSPAKDSPIDKVCVRTPIGGPGIALDWDAVRVIR
jgi:hypothetical protein